MRISEITPRPDWRLTITADDGRIGEFDVTPYLELDAFKKLHAASEFMKISNGGYFIEWDCGADLSVDTLEAHWNVTGHITNKSLV